MNPESAEYPILSDSVAEPKFDVGALAQTELPLSVPYQPIRRAEVQSDSAGTQREIEVFFRKMVPRIPSTTYGTFGLYRYPAKFIPQVVAYIIEAYGAPAKGL